MGRTSSRGAGDAGRSSVAARGIRVLAGAFALAVLPVAGVIAPLPAHSVVTADYPSWEDVVAARKNEAQAKALKASLEIELQVLQDEAQRTQDEANRKGEIYAQALQKYDEQSVVTQSLLEQTAAAESEADEAFTVAAHVIAEMSKSGGTGADLAPRLFTTPGSPEALLNRLEISRVLGERYAGLYGKALELRNAADALADQAEIAKALLEELRIIAEKALQEAQAAAIAAAEKLAETEKDIAEVRSRIEYLEGVREATTTEYYAGVAARAAQWGAGAEGQISATGYTRPHPGYITSHFGMRFNPVSGAWHLHTGVDLAGGGCGATIRAAHGGVVTYAGWLDSWGYYVQLDHGDGTGSGYAHIQAGGIGVSIGQSVAPGQPIAKMGSTGQSTGCHLHFIIRKNGQVVDPVKFMRDQGAPLG